MKARYPALQATALVFLVGVAGCAGVPPRPAELGEARVKNPGKVLVNHDARRARLKSDGNALCPILESRLRKRAIRPIVNVQAPSGYGIDERFSPARDGMMQLGAACLRVGGAPCRTIVDTMLVWARADAAIVQSSGDTSKFWNDSITVNLVVVRPFVGAYAIARATVPVTPDEDDAIRLWVRKVLGRSKHLMRGLHSKGRNYAAHNHAVASAAAFMAYGAMWGDEKAFNHGIDQWFITLGDMRPDGSFPIEARRGARALFYTGRTLSGLMSIAEMARIQGINLYSKAPSDEKTIHTAVSFMVAAMHRHELIYPYAQENYQPGPSKNWKQQHLGSLGSALGWVLPYTTRYPKHPNTRRIQSIRKDPDSDSGAAFDLVLYQGVRVMGHWIGGRADCLYRAS